MSKLKVSILNIDRKDIDKIRNKISFISKILSKELEGKKFNVIPNDKIIELIHKAQGGCIMSRNKVVEANMKYIYICAKKFNDFEGHILSFSDFISEGFLGIIDAIDRYSEQKSIINGRQIKFLSYGTWYITSYMQQAILRNPKGLHFPSRVPNRRFLVEYFEDTVVSKFGSNEYQLGAIYQKPRYLEKNAENGNNFIYSDFYSEVLAATDTLTPRESDVVRCYFGLESSRAMTLEEIGILFDLTRERVRQIKEKAIRRLKHTSRSRILRTYLDFSFSEVGSFMFRETIERKRIDQERRNIEAEKIREVLQDLSIGFEFQIKIDSKKYDTKISYLSLIEKIIKVDIYNFDYSKVLELSFDEFTKLFKEKNIIFK